MSFEIILFDFDGTLADTARCGIEATQQAFKQSRLPIPSERQIVEAMGIPIEKSFKDFGAAQLNEQAFEELLTLFRKIYAEKSDSLITVFDGTLSLLRKLHGPRKVGIVSSKKSGVLRKNAEFLGIADYVSLFIGSDKVKHYKPNPEGISVALEQLNYQGDLNKVIYVGDAATDIKMGHAAGVKTCAVTWGAHTNEELTACNPTYLAHSFHELENILLKSDSFHSK